MGNYKNNDKEKLELLTIIIPLFNRFFEAYQLITYFHKYFSPSKIVVLNNSSKNTPNDFKIFLDSLNISLINYPKKESYASKLADGIGKSVITKYSIICAQDDFLHLPGILSAINFLENNQDFVVCRGKNILFTKLNQFYQGSEVYTIDDNSDFCRLFKHISKFSTTFYSLYRSTVLKKIWKKSAEYTTDLRFGEILPSHLTALYGKIKALDIPFSVREYSLGSDGRTTKNIKDFILENTFRKKYICYKKCLLNEGNKLLLTKFILNIIITISFYRYIRTIPILVKIKSFIKSYSLTFFSVPIKKLNKTKKNKSAFNLQKVDFKNNELQKLIEERYVP